MGFTAHFVWYRPTSVKQPEGCGRSEGSVAKGSQSTLRVGRHCSTRCTHAQMIAHPRFRPQVQKLQF